MADSGAAQDNPTKRHCAFCLKLKPFQLCTGCNRRAYCSTKCRDQDWKPSGKGQGHKNWCKIEHGQEDIDWEVRPIPGKGLGIVAKRLIPSKYKIIVEGVHLNPKSHPGIADLAPENGTLKKKFDDNSLKSVNLDGSFVSLRISRVNHSCSPNTEAGYCETSNVSFLYACRDIQEGEEICRMYENIYDRLIDPMFANFPVECHLDVLKDLLSKNYDIVCPKECVCNSPEFLLSITKYSAYYEAFEEQQDVRPKVALKIAEKILELMDKELYVSWEKKAELHWTCNKVAAWVDDMNTVRIGFEHVKKAVEIYTELCPLSEEKNALKDMMLLCGMGMFG